MGIAVSGHGEIRGSSVVAALLAAMICTPEGPVVAATEGSAEPATVGLCLENLGSGTQVTWRL